MWSPDGMGASVATGPGLCQIRVPGYAQASSIGTSRSERKIAMNLSSKLFIIVDLRPLYECSTFVVFRVFRGYFFFVSLRVSSWFQSSTLLFGTTNSHEDSRKRSNHTKAH